MSEQSISVLENKPDSFKRLFLIEFTRELIRNSGLEFFELRDVIEKTEKPLIKTTPEQKIKGKREEIREKIKKREKKLREQIKKPLKIKKIKSELRPPLKKPKTYPLKKPLQEPKIPSPITTSSIPSPTPTPIPKQELLQKRAPSILRIPQPSLPATFRYLKPIPIQRDIDLGKLNILLKDPLVKIIECNGPDENIYVRGTMGRKPTGIVLNKGEINEIINRFSEQSKIPIYTGIYRVVFGRLILSAIISEVVNVRFLIRKMNISSQVPRMQMR
jgi:hypothetical protein